MVRCSFSGLLLCLVSAVSVHAQTIVPALPTTVDILILPASGDASSIVPLATRTTVIATVNATTGAVTANAQCGRQPTTGPTTQLLNPTIAEFDDPFAAGKRCVAPLPTGLPDGAGYRAVGIFTAPSCQPTPGGPLISPCSSQRSQVGVPPFTVASARTPPVVLTGLAVRP